MQVNKEIIDTHVSFILSVYLLHTGPFSQVTRIHIISAHSTPHTSLCSNLIHKLT